MDNRNNEMQLPEIGAMLRAATQISDLYFGSTTRLLPAVRERLDDLSRLVSGANDTMRTKVLAGVVMLNNQLSEGQSDIELEECEQEEDLLRVQGKLKSFLNEIEAAITDVAGYKAPDTSLWQATLRKTRESQHSAAGSIEKDLKKQQQRLIELDEVITACDVPSVRKAFQNLIPTEEELDTILRSVKDPALDADVLKAAVRKLNRNLDLLENGRKFSDLSRARDTLYAHIESIQGSLSLAKAELQGTDDTIAQFATVDELISLKGLWLKEAKKFQRSSQSLQDRLAKVTQVPALTAVLRDALAYLIDVRRHFEAA